MMRLVPITHRILSNKSYNWSSMSTYNQDGLPGDELVFTSAFGSTRLVVNDARRTTYYL